MPQWDLSLSGLNSPRKSKLNEGNRLVQGCAKMAVVSRWRVGGDARSEVRLGGGSRPFQGVQGVERLRFENWKNRDEWDRRDNYSLQARSVGCSPVQNPLERNPLQEMPSLSNPVVLAVARDVSRLIVYAPPLQQYSLRS